MNRLEVDDNNVRLEPASSYTPLRKSRSMRSFCLKAAVCLCFLFSVAVITLTIVFGPKALGFVDKLRRPYAGFYALDPDNELNVVPLFDANTMFDVAVTIWKRVPCQDEECPVWGGYMEKNVPEEVQVFSDVVMRGFSVKEKERQVNMTFNVPLDSEPRDKRWRYYGQQSRYDVRAAVAFLPQSPSPLDRVTDFTPSTPPGMLVPPGLGDRLKASGDWGDDGSIRRQVLENMVFHVPLIRRHYQRDGGRKRYIVDRAHLFIMNETHAMDQDKWLESFETLSEEYGRCGRHRLYYRRGLNQNGSWDMCRGFESPPGTYYREQGHFLANVEAGSTLFPFKGRRSKDETISVKLTLVMSSYSPTRALQIQTHDEIFRHREHDSERESRFKQDLWAFSRGLMREPVEGGNTWRRILFVGTHKLMSILVVILTLVYWYTRKTAAGISHAGIWMRVVVVIPSSIHYVLTNDAIRRPLEGGPFGFITVIAAMCIGEVLQLRLISLFDLRRKGWGMDFTGSWWTMDLNAEDPSPGVAIDSGLKLKIKWPMRRAWSHRERDTMRFEPFKRTVILTASTFAACVFFFIICRGDIIPPKLPRADDPRTIDALAATGMAVSWAGYATANILQLRMNHLAGSFAGTYALIAYMKMAIEICNVLYNFTFIMGAYYVSNGLSIFEASSSIFAAATMYQAMTLPKVDQNIPDDDE